MCESGYNHLFPIPNICDIFAGILLKTSPLITPSVHHVLSMLLSNHMSNPMYGTANLLFISGELDSYSVLYIKIDIT